MNTYSNSLKRSAMWFALILSVQMLATGCTAIHDYYALPHVPFESNAEPISKMQGPSVGVSFQFQTNGQHNLGVTNKYHDLVVSIIEKSRIFSSVKPGFRDSSARMEIVMNNRTDSLGGAIAQGFLSGLTFGLIGTKVIDDYDLTATYTPPDSKIYSKPYKASLVSTSGIIHGGVDNAESKDSVDEAFKEILNRVVKAWLVDLQKAEVL